MYKKIKKVVRAVLKDENLYKKVKAKLKRRIGQKYEFMLKDFETLIKDNPENLKEYLMQKFPNREAQFVAKVFEAYGEDNKKIFQTDINNFAHKISEIELEKGLLGSEIIKRSLKDKPAKYRLLGIN